MFTKLLPANFRQKTKLFLYLKNWFSVTTGRAREAKFRNGQTLPETDIKKILSAIDFFRFFPKGRLLNQAVTFPYENKNIVFTTGKLPISIVNEVFGAKVYDKFFDDYNLASRQVVDIGGLIGDTALYFALKGADKVYIYEPMTPFYKIILRNIEQNGFGAVCEAVNAGVGRGESFFERKETKDWFFHDKLYIEEGELKPQVPMFTLNDILNRHQIKDGLLKLDVDGYEYEIIEDASKETLRSFDRIVMEYHFGIKNLAEKLESSGFKVEYSKPQKSVARYVQGPKHIQEVGYLKAARL